MGLENSIRLHLADGTHYDINQLPMKGCVGSPVVRGKFLRTCCMIKRIILAFSLAIASLPAFSAETIKSGHVMGNGAASERTPTDTSLLSVMQQPGSGLGTGVATALGLAIGTPGAPVTFNGAGGTPSSLGLANATGLPIAGLSGLGSGIPAALALPVNGTGGLITYSLIGTSGATIPLLNGLNNFSPDGSTQTNVGQFVSMTRAYPGLSGQYDPVRVQIGGFPTSDEYGIQGAVAVAITGAISIPAGATSSLFDAGIAGYCQSANGTKSCVGLFGESGMTANISPGTGGVWGVNTEAINCENHSTTNCGPGKGFDFSLAYGGEFDLSLFKKGSSVPVGQGFGATATLFAEVSPSSGVFGFAVLTSSYTISNGVKWTVGFTTADGSANTGLELGATAPSGSSINSQPIVFNYFNAGGAEQFASLYADSTNTLQTNSNINIAGSYGVGGTFGVTKTCTVMPTVKGGMISAC